MVALPSWLLLTVACCTNVTATALPTRRPHTSPMNLTPSSETLTTTTTTTLASSSTSSSSTLSASALAQWRCGGGATAITTASNSSPLVTFVNTIKAARKHLLSAAFARGFAIFTMFPVDTIKTRVQMGQANALRVQGLFKGVGGSLVGQIPYGVLTFGSYEMYKAALLDRFPNVKPIFMVAFAAVLGDFTGSIWVFPSDVVKQKVQGGIYSQTGGAIRSIWSKRGLVGFYEGYLTALARDIPFRVAQLTTYEYTKDVYLRMKKSRMKGTGSVELSPAEAAVVGAIAGTVAAFITSPLDRFKTLLVTDSEKWGGTIVSCAAQVWKQEGPRGLLKGVVPRLAYITPSVAIFFVAYEFAQQKLKKWESSE